MSALRKHATLKDVARAAGVHSSTVSRALNPASRHLVSPALVETILEVSRAMEYSPNGAAYSLRTSRSRTIGLIVPDIANAIFPPIIRGVESVLIENGYQAFLGNTDSDSRRETNLVDAFLARGVDGLILASVQRVDEAVERLLGREVPIVTVNRRVDDRRVSSVIHDEVAGVRWAMTHLVSLGHREIAVIGGPQALSTGTERHRAFELARANLGLEGNPRLVTFADAYTESAGDRCLEELIARGIRFTAVMCANDRLAVGAIAALHRRGWRCPDDVSVTGYNDMPMMDRITPPLTTVRVQQYEMGVEAGQMLMRQMSGNAEPQHVVLPVELTVRGSTAAVQGH